MPKKKTDVQMMTRVKSELLERFDRAIETEAKMHGFEEHTRTMVVRNMMREYILRVESVAESAMGREAAKVLRGAKRA